jgi:low affinity Fe/Cu permease
MMIAPIWAIAILEPQGVLLTDPVHGDCASSRSRDRHLESHESLHPEPLMNQLFQKLAQRSALAMGSAWAFLLALLTILVWAALGPPLHFSENWQLVINTSTTIVTFLMVFLIQSTQNRDTKAVHLKLDELIRAIHGARNSMVDLENCTEEELDRLQRDFERLRQRAMLRDKHPPLSPDQPASRPAQRTHKPNAAPS